MGGNGSSANSLALRHTELFSVAFHFSVLRTALLQKSRKNNGCCRNLLVYLTCIHAGIYIFSLVPLVFLCYSVFRSCFYSYFSTAPLLAEVTIRA